MKFCYLLIFSAPFFALSANNVYRDFEVSRIISIYDGDTFKVDIDYLPPVFGKNISIRIARIDTPEIHGKCQKEKVLARKAKQATVAALRSASYILLKNIKRGKYFRLVADVYVDGKLLSDKLLNNGLAVRYFGKNKKKDWCK